MRERASRSMVATSAAVVLAQEGTYNSGTELVVLQVSVVDQQQRYVSTLRRWPPDQGGV